MRQKHRLRPKTAFSSVIKSANFTMGAWRCYGIAGRREIGPFGGTAGIRRLGVPQDVGEQKRLLRGLLNVRPARGATEDF